MRVTHFLAVGASMWLAACADMPVPPPRVDMPLSQLRAATPQSTDARLGDSLEQRRQIARQRFADGDLAAAAAQWQILVLLAPDEASFRQELEATQSTLTRSAAAAYQSGLTALKQGDSDEAARLMLRVLALDPEHVQAGQILRKIEKERIARIQSEKANRARREDERLAIRPQPTISRTTEYRRSFDLEQTIELFVAGDESGGLRELRRYVEANPDDKVGRNRISAIVAEQAQKLDTAATRERAASLYEQAVSLRGEAPPAWASHLDVLRKTLASEYYDRAMRAYRSDLSLAIRHLETSVRYDPQHVNAALRLKEARTHQNALKRIEKEKSAR